MMQPRILELRTSILKKNDALARQLRVQFARRGLLVVNVVSAPGSGKTELLTRTLTLLNGGGPSGPVSSFAPRMSSFAPRMSSFAPRKQRLVADAAVTDDATFAERKATIFAERKATTLAERRVTYRTAAIVGDLATENDAQRLATSGSPTKQILTGTMCHLEADMVAGALADWNLSDFDFLFIENVGNLVCPSSWDLGEDLRVLLCAVTEGEDKPLKYPTLINSADVVVVSKLDLAAAIEFDLALLLQNIERVRPGVPVFQLSAKTGEGLDEWCHDLTERLEQKRTLNPDPFPVS
ncbi:MAG TPA: hydrogenase nickel incorporation protein HypB [Pirellulales bacterium]